MYKRTYKHQCNGTQSSLQLTVESDYTIAIATLSDWFKNLQPVFQPIRSKTKLSIRAVFKLLSKVITWLRLLHLVIGLKDSRHFFNQWEAKPKPIAPYTCDFSRTTSELQVIARNCDWFIALFVPVVIGRRYCFGFGFSTVIWKPLYFSDDHLAKACPCRQPSTKIDSPRKSNASQT